MSSNWIFKVTFFSAGGVEKTALIQRYVTSSYAERDPTGIWFSVKDVTLDTGESVRLQLWDCDFGERTRFLMGDTCKGSSGVIICYDITDYTTFEAIPDFLTIIRKNTENIPIILMGLGYELPNHEVDQETADQYAEQSHCLMNVFVSSKMNLNIEPTFTTLAKWLIYYATREKEVVSETKNSLITTESLASVLTTISKKEEILSIKKSEKPDKVNNAKRIFISYATDDGERFRIPEIAAALSGREMIGEVLYWQKDVSDNIIQYMNKNVDLCDVLILICTAKALKSKAVESEWMAVEYLGKPILPVFMDPKDIPALLKSRLGVKFEHINFADFIQELYEKLQKKLRGSADDVRIDSPVKTASPAEISEKEILNQLSEIIAVSPRVKQAQVAKYVGISEDVLFRILIAWGKVLPFKMDGDYIIVQDVKQFKEKLAQYIAQLTK